MKGVSQPLNISTAWSAKTRIVHLANMCPKQCERFHMTRQLSVFVCQTHP